MIFKTIEEFDYELSKSEDELNQFIDSCPYRFSDGKHIGGCGCGDAPKGSDTKGGCHRNHENNECPRL